MCVCVLIPRFLQECVCFVGREVEERWKNSFSPSWNWLLCLCFRGQCDHTLPHPLSELKSPRHMHAPLLSLSQTILCSGHTFAIVLLTTKQTAANISSLYLSLSCAGLSSLPESSVAAALCGAELFLCCCFVHFWPWLPACSHFNPAFMIATVCFGDSFSLLDCCAFVVSLK